MSKEMSNSYQVEELSQDIMDNLAQLYVRVNKKHRLYYIKVSVSKGIWNLLLRAIKYIILLLTLTTGCNCSTLTTC